MGEQLRGIWNKHDAAIITYAGIFVILGIIVGVVVFFTISNTENICLDEPLILISPSMAGQLLVSELVEMGVDLREEEPFIPAWIWDGELHMQINLVWREQVYWADLKCYRLEMGEKEELIFPVWENIRQVQ